MDGQSQETCTLDDPYWVFITVAEKLRCQNDILYQPLYSVVENTVIPNIVIVFSLSYPTLWGIIFQKYGASFIVIKSFDDIQSTS